MHEACTHSAMINGVPAPRDVCEACVEVGGTWVHLRQCLTCARTLCCNDSPNRHMTGHFDEIGHPIMRGAGAGEDWTWCFADDAMIRESADGWETYDPFVDAGISMAREHLEATGGVDPGEDLVTSQGFPLGEWFAYVRELHDDGELD
ncbi:MAG TPA: UBP-type zinc finger domain-containing protein, partial [Candidatus Limnocylindrales bacterium]|nr:UBP-type zinc finger domain-containing protein [Candidatus Limnocylindrales bacterium]